MTMVENADRARRSIIFEKGADAVVTSPVKGVGSERRDFKGLDNGVQQVGDQQDGSSALQLMHGDKGGAAEGKKGEVEGKEMAKRRHTYKKVARVQGEKPSEKQSK
jgi:hypothetical protein